MSRAVTGRDRRADCPTLGAPRGHATVAVISPLRSPLALERGANLREVVKAVAHRMILEHELTGERRVSVQRVGRDAIELGIADGTDRGRRGRAVPPHQGE